MKRLFLIFTLAINNLYAQNNSSGGVNYWSDTNYLIYSVKLNVIITPLFDKDSFEIYLIANGVNSIDRNNLLNQVEKVEMGYSNSVTPSLRQVLILFSANPYLLDTLNNLGAIFLSAYKKFRPVALYTPNDFINNFFVGDGISRSHLELIKAEQAWEITTGDTRIRVGVIDLGITTNHEELNGRVTILSNSQDQDDINHGTLVAGLIAGNTDNGIGMSSICGYRTQLFFHGVNQVNAFNEMIVMARDNNVRVINNSWWNPGQCTINQDEQSILDELRNNWNVLVIFAAGNGADCSTTDVNNPIINPNSLQFPASSNNVLNVSGVGHISPIGDPPVITPGVTGNWKDLHPNNLTAPFSTQQHNATVDVVAPSWNVPGLGGTSSNAYNWIFGNGTSFAAPMVAGVAALMFSANPCLTAQQAEDAIRQSADGSIYNHALNQPYIGLLGTGRVDAYRAVKRAMEYSAQQNINYGVSPVVVWGHDLLVGRNVTNLSPIGNVIIGSQSNVTYTVKRTVEIFEGFEVMQGGFFEVITNIDSPCF